MPKKLNPIRNCIIVKPIKIDAETAGGIIVPDCAQGEPIMGEVLAVGPGERIKGELIPMTIKAGDTILLSGAYGRTVMIDNETFIIVDEDDVEATIVDA